MELLRSALGFFLSNADILAIILLSIAVIRINYAVLEPLGL